VGPDPDLGPPSTATVQTKNREMTSATEHSFRHTLSSLQRKDRELVTKRYSDTLDSWKDDAVQRPYVPAVRLLSLLILLPFCQIGLCIFVSYLAPLFPTFGKGGEESLCGKTESKQMESVWGPKALQHLLLPYRHNSSSRGQDWLRREGWFLAAASPR